jgi:hypothetical protein
MRTRGGRMRPGLRYYHSNERFDTTGNLSRNGDEVTLWSPIMAINSAIRAPAAVMKSATSYSSSMTTGT